MAVKKVDIETFLELVKDCPVIDVRSPGEFEHACFPGAYNLPLFDNQERAVVGTAYKQKSRQAAIKLGLDYFGKKMVKMVEQVEKIAGEALNNKATIEQPGNGQQVTRKKIFVHCWRGGMRSAGVAWLLDLYGFEVYTIVGGYKAFRNWVLRQFQKEYCINILGGYTGSGKTEVLKQLKNLGENVIDLEGLANHKGSAFGNIDMHPQPSQEMFENKLAVELWKCSKRAELNSEIPQIERALVKAGSAFNPQQPDLRCVDEQATPNQPVWIEDESQRIGTVNIPILLWNQLRTKPVYFLDIPFEERLDYLVKDYGKGDREKLVNAIIRIKKRLGGLEAKTAVNFLLEDDIKESFRVLLKYYDKLYTKGLQNRDNWQHFIINVESHKVNATDNARKILERQKKQS